MTPAYKRIRRPQIAPSTAVIWRVIRGDILDFRARVLTTWAARRPSQGGNLGVRYLNSAEQELSGAVVQDRVRPLFDSGSREAGASHRDRGCFCPCQWMFTSRLVPGKGVAIGVFSCHRMLPRIRANHCIHRVCVVLEIEYGASIPRPFVMSGCDPSWAAVRIRAVLVTRRDGQNPIATAS